MRAYLQPKTTNAQGLQYNLSAIVLFRCWFFGKSFGLVNGHLARSGGECQARRERGIRFVAKGFNSNKNKYQIVKNNYKSPCQPMRC